MYIEHTGCPTCQSKDDQNYNIGYALCLPF